MGKDMIKRERVRQRQKEKKKEKLRKLSTEKIVRKKYRGKGEK